jgi:2,3-bisphosphoglycerate-dependent phosphoglycerate mutase
MSSACHAVATRSLVAFVAGDATVFAVMELILIRHARPELHVVDAGVADPGLTELGWEQARRLARWLMDEDIHHIAVSPKRRALETATPLAEKLGIEPEVVEGFAELDKSSRAYVPVEDLQDEQHKHILEKMRNRDWAGLGYQDPLEFREEVIEAQRELLVRHPDKRIAIVAHGGTINAIVSGVLNIPEMFFFHAGYTSITRLVRSEWNDKWVVRSINEEAHLHTEPNTLSPL